MDGKKVLNSKVTEFALPDVLILGLQRSLYVGIHTSSPDTSLLRIGLFQLLPPDVAVLARSELSLRAG